MQHWHAHVVGTADEILERLEGIEFPSDEQTPASRQDHIDAVKRAAGTLIDAMGKQHAFSIAVSGLANPGHQRVHEDIPESISISIVELNEDHLRAAQAAEEANQAALEAIKVLPEEIRRHGAPVEPVLTQE